MDDINAILKAKALDYLRLLGLQKSSGGKAKASSSDKIAYVLNFNMADPNETMATLTNLLIDKVRETISARSKLETKKGGIGSRGVSLLSGIHVKSGPELVSKEKDGSEVYEVVIGYDDDEVYRDSILTQRFENYSKSVYDVAALIDKGYTIPESKGRLYGRWPEGSKKNIIIPRIRGGANFLQGGIDAFKASTNFDDYGAKLIDVYVADRK